MEPPSSVLCEHFGLLINLIQIPQSDYLFVRGQQIVEIKTQMKDTLTKWMKCLVYYIHILIEFNLNIISIKGRVRKMWEFSLLEGRGSHFLTFFPTFKNEFQNMPWIMQIFPFWGFKSGQCIQIFMSIFTKKKVLCVKTFYRAYK